MSNRPGTLGPGRPRGFDATEALDAATRCFWGLGYDRASIAVLCDAMALSRASLYAEFGDKDGLFLAALDHYSRTYSGPAQSALTSGGEARAAVLAFFDAMIELVTGNPDTPGCLIACVLSEAATARPAYREILARKTDALETRIAQALRPALPFETEEGLRARAGMLAATARGLAISARAGRPPERLRDIARVATGLACAPAPSPASLPSPSPLRH